MEPMYTQEQIEQLFDKDVIKYLKKKNEGGFNNQKGNTYENLFAVYQIALLSRQSIDNNCHIKLYSQILSFVDDLIIDFQKENSLKHYQLKNSPNITWGTGKKSICDDFQSQYILNQSISRNSELHLVVSDRESKNKLAKNIPEEIKVYSQVLYFPYEASLIKFITRESNFREAIVYLSAFENPEPDKIECVVKVLLGAWVSSDLSGVFLIDILKNAQACNPSYIRSFCIDCQLDPEVENILNQIDNFSYNLTKGFLHWSYADGLEEGTLPYSIDTDRFRQFQDLIKRDHPTSFDQLEVFLI